MEMNTLNNRIKTFCLLCLIIINLFVYVSGCTKEEKTFEIYNDQVLTVASSGLSRFTVVYYEKEYNKVSDLRNKITELISQTETKTGAKLNLEPKEALIYEEDDYQILIGDTGFPETELVKAKLDYNDYAIARVGNKIVIVGGGVSSTVKALDKFNENIFGREYNIKKYIEFSDDMKYSRVVENEVESIKIGDFDIGDYDIVLPVSETTVEDEFAVMLQQEIATKEGTLLDITQKNKENRKKIFIGTAGNIAENISASEYIIAVHEGDVHIAAGSASAYDYAYEKFCQLFTEQKNNVISADLMHREDLSEQFAEAGNALGDKTGDIRLLYHNLYGYDRTPTINTRRRFRLQKCVYADYKADMIMFQEYSDAAGNEVPKNMTDIGYKCIANETDGYRLHTPIYYNPDVLEVVKSDHLLYTYEYAEDPRIKNDTTKSVAWSVMRVKETGKMFIVMNTHFYWSEDKTDLNGNNYNEDDPRYMLGSNLARIDNATQLLNVLDNLYKIPEYASLPVIVGGDMNCRYTDTDIKSIREKCQGRIALHVLTDYGLKSAQITAPISDTGSTQCGYPKYDNYYGYYYKYGGLSQNKQQSVIDHIFYKGEGLNLKLFDIIDTTFIRKTSDHLPIYADFDL